MPPCYQACFPLRFRSLSAHQSKNLAVSSGQNQWRWKTSERKEERQGHWMWESASNKSDLRTLSIFNSESVPSVFASIHTDIYNKQGAHGQQWITIAKCVHSLAERVGDFAVSIHANENGSISTISLSVRGNKVTSTEEHKHRFSSIEYEKWS